MAKKDILGKENVFNHVFYEFQMYLFTYYFIYPNCLIKNITIESHLTHLRNVAAFFDDRNKNRSGYVVYSDYINSADLGIDKQTADNVQRYVSQSVSHITKDRHESDLTSKTIPLKKEMFCILKCKISDYMVLLDNDLKPNFKESYNLPSIMELRKCVNDLLENDKFITLDIAFSVKSRIVCKFAFV